jgi:hypothetical protein
LLSGLEVGTYASYSHARGEHEGENMVQLFKIREKRQKILKNGLPPGTGSGSNDPMQSSEIIDWLVERQESFVGSSYYYIREGREQFVICRLKISGGYLYSIDVIDHEEHGISNDDIADAVRSSDGEPEIPGHYHIDRHIEQKLRTLLDI